VGAVSQLAQQNKEIKILQRQKNNETKTNETKNNEM
jgi:hypothetical protein